MFAVVLTVASYTRERAAAMCSSLVVKLEFCCKQYGEHCTMINKTAPFGMTMDYFHRFYEYFEVKGKLVFPGKSGN